MDLLFSNKEIQFLRSLKYHSFNKALLCTLFSYIFTPLVAEENQPKFIITKNKNHFEERNYPKLFEVDFDKYYLLYVLDKGQKYLIEPNRYDWYVRDAFKEVTATIDLDGDGDKEALLRTQGSGNCCGPKFYIIDKVEDGFFSLVTHEELSGWPSVSIKEGDGGPEIWVNNMSEGMENTSQESTLTILKFENGTLLEEAKYFNSAFLISNLEVTSAEVSSGENKVLIVDLDFDGQMDQMVCSYWARWGAVNCDINSSKHGEFPLSGGCNRIGILETATNGVRDLVCNRDDILRFNQKEARYEYGN